MNRFFLPRSLSILCIALTCATAAQPRAQDNATQRKFGKLYKGQVDGLINGLAAARRPDGSLGDGSLLQTAQMLVAMGQCHRFYSLSLIHISEPTRPY